jgi:predicted component of type VI protein secretion system
MITEINEVFGGTLFHVGKELGVRFTEGSTTITPGMTWSFGRDSSCDLSLGQSDLSISRRAGLIEGRDGFWCLHNTSSTRPLQLVDGVGLRSNLAVGRRTAITDDLAILVVGSHLTHRIDVSVEADVVDLTTESPPPGESTLMPTFSASERATLAALAEGYLRGHPRYEPRPRTYSEAARSLCLPASTVRKRAERIRQKLVRAGVVELEVDDARGPLTEFVLATGLVTAADLDRLESD